jgi:hypothetical protein
MARPKVTYDRKSGRPIAPMYWRTFPFWLAYSWGMAGQMAIVAYFCIRNGDLRMAAAAVAVGAFHLIFVYHEKRCIARERRAFDQSVAAYERALSNRA